MTVQDTLTRAIKMTGARGLNETPSAAEMAEALNDFQAMLLSLPRVTLVDVPITAAYTAGENERVLNITTAALSVTLPETVTDTDTGAQRTPRNGAVVEIAAALGSLPLRYIYISELGSWMKVSQLALSDEQPFGPEHDQGLAAMSAARIAGPLFQRDASQTVIGLAQEGRRSIRQRFRQTFTATTDPLLLNVFQRCGTQV